MLLFSQQTSCVISVKNVVSSTFHRSRRASIVCVGMINDRKESTLWSTPYDLVYNTINGISHNALRGIRRLSAVTVLTNESYFKGNL